MATKRIIVDAIWDAEACVFVATSQDVPGLIAEAGSMEALYHKLDSLVPEMIEANRPGQAEEYRDAELVVIAEKRSIVRLHA